MRVGMGLGPLYVSGKVGGRRRRTGAVGWLVGLGVLAAIALVAAGPVGWVILAGLVAMVLIVPRYVRRKQASRRPVAPPVRPQRVPVAQTPQWQPRPPQAPVRPVYAPRPTFTPNKPR